MPPKVAEAHSSIGDHPPQQLVLSRRHALTVGTPATRDGSTEQRSRRSSQVLGVPWPRPLTLGCTAMPCARLERSTLCRAWLIPSSL
jgi:hypothetical protein